MIRRGAVLASMILVALSAPAETVSAAGAGMLAGVNFAGAEDNPDRPRARLGFDYVYPTEAEIAWAASHGMTAIRLPVEWSRLQPALEAPLDPAEMGRVLAVVRMADAHGIRVVLDLHDYGSWRGLEVGSTALSDRVFADSWRRIAIVARGQPGMVLGLMNEPHTMPAARWEASAQAALDAISATGARNLVLIPGAGWDGAHSWTEGGSGSNAAAMERLLVPQGGHAAFEFHQYFDRDHSGTKPDCLAPAEAVKTLEGATAWLAAGRRQGFLGEFGTAGTTECLATLDAVLSFLDAHQAEWIGWTYWAAGRWWGNYMFSVEPQDGKEKPQMAVLARHLKSSGKQAQR